MRNRAYFIGYIIILVTAGFALRHMWQQQLDTRLLVAEDGIEDAAVQLESLIDKSISHINVLRLTAENLLHDLEGGHHSAAAIDRHVHVSVVEGGYCSDGTELPTQLTSSISGLGLPPAAGSTLGQEVEMALLLAPQFEATAHNIPNMAWAYYTSARRFIAMYPNVSCAEFFFSDELHTHEFFLLGFKGANPSRSLFWTSAYVDQAGKGLMATIGAPIDDAAGNFRGTVAIDLTLETLSTYILGQELEVGRLLIVNAQKQVIADRALMTRDIKAAPQLAEWLPHPGFDLDDIVFGAQTGFVAKGGELIASRPLKGAPWRLVYVADRSTLEWLAWKDSWVEVGGLLLLLLVILAFETARRRSWQLKQRVAELDAANEAAHKARKDADDANRAKSLMMANVSHDLRTPLNAIIGFSDVMQHQMFGPMAERYVAYARDIKASGELLLRIINSLLDLAKVESGQYKLQEEVVDLGGLADMCRRLTAEQAENAGIRLTSEIAPDLPLMNADPRALQRVVLNLLSNGIKFTKPGGAVTLTVWRDPMGRLNLSVADTGAGISRKDLEHLFRPFSRGESALTANQEGTGLGLSIVKSLVELHGGKVSMESAVGVGTTVTVQLPAFRCQRTENRGQRTEDRSSRPLSSDL